MQTVPSLQNSRNFFIVTSLYVAINVSERQKVDFHAVMESQGFTFRNNFRLDAQIQTSRYTNTAL